MDDTIPEPTKVDEAFGDTYALCDKFSLFAIASRLAGVQVLPILLESGGGSPTDQTHYAEFSLTSDPATTYGKVNLEQAKPAHQESVRRKAVGAMAFGLSLATCFRRLDAALQAGICCIAGRRLTARQQPQVSNLAREGGARS